MVLIWCFRWYLTPYFSHLKSFFELWAFKRRCKNHNLWNSFAQVLNLTCIVFLMPLQTFLLAFKEFFLVKYFWQSKDVNFFWILAFLPITTEPLFVLIYEVLLSLFSIIILPKKKSLMFMHTIAHYKLNLWLFYSENYFWHCKIYFQLTRTYF